MNYLFVMGFFLLGATAQSAVIDFKPMAIEIKPRDVLRIRGFDGDIKLSPAKGQQLVVKVRQESDAAASGPIKQSLDEWNFSAQRVDGAIELVVQSPQAKELWRHIFAQGGAPRFHLEVSAPPMSVDLAWRSGKISADNWGANIHVNLQSGNIAVQGGSGDTKLFGQNVDLRIKNRTGRVVAESYSGKVVIEDIKGPVEVENFSGESSLQRVDGNVDFHSYKAPLNLNASKGRVEFETVRGPIKITAHSGSLKGQTDEASVTARLSGAQEVRITSQSGPINLELPNSGASLSLSSVDGPIFGPPHLKSEQGTGQRVLRGRMKGGDDGSVVVRSQSGSIKIR